MFRALAVAIIAGMSLLAINSLTSSIPADARGRGGPGGGHHFGGGHFGGRHFGNFGGGHFGGHRFAHFGGRHFGVRHFGGHRFTHFGPGGGRHFAHPGGVNRFAGRMHHFRGGNLAHANRGLRGRNFADNRNFANHGRALAANGRLTRASARHAFGRGFAHNGFWNRRDAGGRFGRGWHGYGWYGPVFWPYAFGDIFAFALWPYDYYDPFWDYGAGWIVSSLFWPGGEPGYYNYGDARYYGDIYGFRTARRDTSTATASVPLQLQQDACGSLGPGIAQLPEGRIEKAIAPITDEQRAALNDFVAAMGKGADLMKQACPVDAPLTPPAKLDAVTQRLEAMKSAIGIVRDPLDKLYSLLSDDQRRHFDQALLVSPRRSRTATQQAANLDAAKLCSDRGPAFGDLPAAEIEKAISLDDGQRGKLDQLKTVSQKADDIANSGCVSSMPSTVGARLDATEKRVNALIEAANTLKPAVDDFYASLSDEQKARFNSINQTALSSSANPATNNGAGSGEAGSGGSGTRSH